MLQSNRRSGSSAAGVRLPETPNRCMSWADLAFFLFRALVCTRVFGFGNRSCLGFRVPGYPEKSKRLMGSPCEIPVPTIEILSLAGKSPTTP